jgi:hypothetical protein
MVTCTKLILEHLEEFGPATCAELCRQLPSHRKTILGALRDLRKVYLTKPKRVYIQGYTYDDEVKQRYPRAIYAAGDKPDARRPKPEKGTARTKRWREKQVLRTRDNKRMAIAANSVFNWRP